MFFSSLIIKFKVLHLLRLQDTIGSDAWEKYLFAVACIAVANEYDKNLLGRPLFMKSLSKATLIAMNYCEIKYGVF